MNIITNFKGDQISCNFLKEEKFWKYVNLFVLLIINIMCLGLSLYENFWYDEAYTIGMIQRDFSDIWHTTSQDVHPPLYYFLLKAFYIFPGMRELLSVKVFSWMFYLFYLLLGSHICRKHYNRKVEFFWLVLSGFMSPMIILATSPRMYTLAIFSVTLALYMAYLSVKKNRPRYWIFFTVVCGFTMYLHTFCMIELFVLYAFMFLWALFKKKYKMLGKIFLSGLCVSATYIPWLLVLWKQFSRWAGWETGWSNTIAEFSIHSVYSWMAEWFSALENPNLIVIVLCATVCIIGCCSAVRYMVKTKDYLPCIGTVLAVIVVGVATIVTITIVPCFLGRYIFPLFGAMFLLIAVGIDQIKYNWIKVLLIAIIVGCGLFTYKGELVLEAPTGLNTYRTYMDENLEEDDLIMADSYFQMMMSIYYPENEYMVYGNVPPCMPFADCKAFTQWEQLQNKDTIWYLSFSNFKRGGLDQRYEVTDKLEIKYYYYNIILEKYVKKE